MKVGILLYEGFTALDAVGPYEVLSRIPEARVSFVAKNQGIKRSDTGALALVADLGFSDLVSPEVVVVPGGTTGAYGAAEDEEVLDWVRRAHAGSKWTTSVCTGALILGAAGVLRGLDATTHWAASRDLHGYGASYRPERFVRRGKVVTAAGVSAGIDMALFLAGELCGADVARAIQLTIEYDPEPPFDSGTRRKASPETTSLSKKMLRKAAVSETGRALFRKLPPDPSSVGRLLAAVRQQYLNRR